MSELYRELLDATYYHLLDLKQEGARYVALTPEAWRDFTAPPTPPKATAPAAPVAPRPAVAPRVQTPVAAPAPVTGSPASQPPFTDPPLMGAAKVEAMRDLGERASVCQKCPPLARSRKTVVFGTGDINSPVMFIGEAPGADEDLQGEPFVGKAGQLLTKIIQTMGFSRETVYIANILKCRPDTPGQTAGNRKPTTDEVNTCLPYLMAQIDLIRPKVIVALGATAIEGLFGGPAAITRTRGQWREFRGIPLMPTYHPSYLLRNQALAVKREVWEDMLKVLERLGSPISDKQRGYFLPPPPAA